MSSPRTIIAGVGLLTPLGHSAWETFAALLGGRTIADRAAALPDDVAPVDLVRALGCVSVAQHIGVDPAVELADRAAREALFDARLPDNPACPIFLGTSKGAIASLQSRPSAAPAKPLNTIRDPQVVTLGPHAYLANELQRRLRLPVVSHHVAACASSLVALHQARQHLLHSNDDTALVLTSEAALTPLFIHSYRRLGVLAPLTAADYRCRPLDRHACGFMLAELAAAVVVRRVDQPQPGDIELCDTAVGSESFDIVRPAPTMTALAHLAQSLLGDRAIDMLHPHAPGTPEHDPAELTAYQPLAAPNASTPASSRPIPDLYAVKGALGHGLGAAGLVSLVIACLIARAGRRPPMPWLSDPIDVPPFTLTPEAPPPTPARTHAIFAAGFAGHLAAALIQRH